MNFRQFLKSKLKYDFSDYNAPIAAFFHVYSKSRNAAEFDAPVIIAGEEGSMKSMLALIAMAASDPDFLNEIENRIFLAKGFQLVKFYDMIIANAKAGKRGFAYNFDEFQNVMNAQQVSEKDAVQLKQFYRTKRFIGDFAIHCTPNLGEIDREILKRMGLIIVLNNNGDSGSGGIFADPDIKARLLNKIQESKNNKIPVPKTLKEIQSLFGIYPDFYFKFEFDYQLYRKYAPLKVENSIDMIEKLRNDVAKKNGLDEREFEDSEVEEIGKIEKKDLKPTFNVQSGGEGMRYDELPPIPYENDFISASVVKSVMNYGNIYDYIKTGKVTWREVKINGKSKKYVKIGDIKNYFENYGKKIGALEG